MFQFAVTEGQSHPRHLAVIILEAFLIAVGADEDDFEAGAICFHFVVEIHKLKEEAQKMYYWS